MTDAGCPISPLESPNLSVQASVWCLGISFTCLLAARGVTSTWARWGRFVAFWQTACRFSRALRWAKTRVKKTHTRALSRCAFLKTLACRGPLQALVDSVSVRFKNARVEKMPLNILACSKMREPLASRSAFLKTLARRGLLRVSPSRLQLCLLAFGHLLSPSFH